MAARFRSQTGKMSGSPPDAPGPPTRGSRRTAGRAAAVLLAQALASDDAEAAGIRADEVLADGERALVLLGDPGGPVEARNAVVQRYGRAGALLVIGYEERWLAAGGPGPAPTDEAGRDPAFLALLDQLIDGFGDLDTAQLAELLAAVEAAEGSPSDGEVPRARRWLHATYAVAARDGTDTAHRAYMVALDAVMRLATPRIAC